MTGPVFKLKQEEHNFMTDNTKLNAQFYLPADVLNLIVRLLDNDELERFRQVCKLFKEIGSDFMILQSLYNRLRTIDKTLLADLPQKGALAAFKQAFAKIQARLQQEIAYLTQHHSEVMAKSEYAQSLQKSSSMSLELLEAKNSFLDIINSEIITPYININSSNLNLKGAHITRLQVEVYTNFWKNLTYLDCSDNQLISLNLQGLTELQWLDCRNNPLIELILTSVPSVIQEEHGYLETIWFLKKLIKLVKSCTSDVVSRSSCLASSILSQAAVYLPSRGSCNNVMSAPTTTINTFEQEQDESRMEQEEHTSIGQSYLTKNVL